MGGPDADETLRPTAGEAGAQRFALGALAADRYRIVRFIAAGGMGEVYAAHDLVLDITVALKTLRPELEGSSTAIARLRREIALARSVTNPHICRLHDVGEHDGRVFLTMELLQGRTLAELVADGALPVTEVERIADQLVDGLAALHRASIIHRDFKTSNVIVVGEGDAARAVITDFGLARSIETGDAMLTLESSLLGTPAYMAPEQVEARPATTASDIYALGVVLFELLTGKLPFREDTAMATATARLQRDPPRPSSIRSEIPARWDQIVLRCLARDPAERFARVEDVLGAAPRSRRAFLVAGGGLLAAGAVGIWRFQAGRSAPALVSISEDDVVAVLPVTGEGELLDDPWRTAFTVDLHAALASSRVPLLALHEGELWVALGGAALWAGISSDPLAAALALPGVVTVVRTKVVARTEARLELEVRITGRGEIEPRRFARPLGEIPQLVAEVATSIASALGFPAAAATRDDARLTADVYRQYGAALAHLFRPRSKAEQAAIDNGTAPRRIKLLQDLVTAIPELVRASVLLAEVFQSLGEQTEDVNEAMPLLDQASGLLERALAIDPSCPVALATRGHVAMLRWDWKQADADTGRAATLSSHERVAFHRNFYLMLSGRFEEAVSEAERKHGRNPDARLGSSSLGWHYYYARRFPDVVRVVEPVLPRLHLAWMVEGMTASMLSLAYAEMARFDDAVRVAEQIRNSGADNYVVGGLVQAYVMAGRIDDAKAIRAKIGANTDLGVIALMEDVLGNHDAALTALEQIVASHNIHAMFMRMERYTPQLRSHPRFQALLKKVGFV